MLKKKAGWAAVAILLVGTGAVYAGCTPLLEEVNQQLEGGAAGAGGMAGAGGTTTTSTDSCPSECCAPEDCPEPDNPCQKRVCRDGGTCGTENLPDGTESSEQTDGDCLTELCDGTGNTKNQLQPTGATCTEDGGQFCNATGVCVECNLDGDCMLPDKPLCKEQVCVPETCDNGMTDPPETDTDCGGKSMNSGCLPCQDGKMCMDGLDCQSGVCGDDKKCKPPACDDKVKNGTETDIDCGGPCSTKCGPNKACNSDADCAGHQCSGMPGTCVPNCMDGIQNKEESDADCGGGTCKACMLGQKCAGDDANCEATAYCDTTMMDVCAPKKAPGAPCSATNECMAGMCSMTDGVCCDMACAGPCVTCTAAGTEGQCTFLNATTDPGDLECPGPQLCNDSGACKDPEGTPCSTNADCAGGFCVDGVCCVEACTGTCKACNLGAPGLCVGVPKGMEDPGTCAGGTNACSGGAGSTCQDAGTKKKLGASCSSNNDCFSNACRAGTCKLATGSACTDATKDNCESYRCGANNQCATCANNNDCLGTSCVIAMGLCTYPAGHACTTGTQCLSGTCSNNVCT